MTESESDRERERERECVCDEIFSKCYLLNFCLSHIVILNASLGLLGITLTREGTEQQHGSCLARHHFTNAH